MAGLPPQMISDLDAALRRWAGDYQRTLRGVGRDGGHQRRGGRRWEPRKQNYPWPTLRSVPLRSSVQVSSYRSFALSNSHEAARYHQSGTRNMAARPPIEFTDRDLTSLANSLEAALTRPI